MDRKIRIQEMLQANPTDCFLRHALALEYVKVGDDAAARVLFTEILSQFPDYIGSYYHLAKLLERQGEVNLAIKWYEQGMEAAKLAKDQHSYQELHGAYEELIY